MKTIKHTIAALFLCSALGAAAAIETATIERTFTDGRKTSETVKLAKVKPNTYRLHIPVGKMGRGVDEIDIKLDQFCANQGEEGYWITSNDALGYFKHEEGKYVLRGNFMPMFGVKKGDKAAVAIVKGLRYEFATIVEAKDGKYQVFPRFFIKQIYTKPYEDIIIDYTEFEGKKANYSSMAREYRNYQLERGEVKPLKERIIGNPTLQNTVSSVYLKLAMASFMREGETGQNRGWHWKVEDDPPIQVWRNFDNVQWFIKKLKEHGVDKVDLILTNWNWRSNGRNPISSIAEPELGGMAKCKETIALAKKLGFRIAPHMLHTENYTISPAFDKNDIALDENGQYRGYMGMGGKGFNPCFIQVFKKHVLEHYDRMAKLGFNGTFHIDVTSAITPYSCHHIEHFATRKDTAEYMNKVGFLSDAFFGAWGSESGFDSTANTLDYVLYATPISPDTINRYQLVDRVVPIWPLVYSGIITSAPLAAFIDNTLPARYRSGWWICKMDNEKLRRVMEVEFNGRPSFYWGLNGVKSDEDFKCIKRAYDEFQQRQYLQLEFMEYHNEIADDVFITRFSDGTRIISNHSDKPFTYRGEQVGALDYKIFKGKKKTQNN